MDDYSERMRAQGAIPSRLALIILSALHAVIIAGSVAGLVISLDSSTDKRWATPAYVAGITYGLAGLVPLLLAASRRAKELFRARLITILLREATHARLIEPEYGSPFDEKSGLLSEAQELRDRLLKAGDWKEASALSDAVIHFYNFLRPRS